MYAKRPGRGPETLREDRLETLDDEGAFFDGDILADPKVQPGRGATLMLTSVVLRYTADRFNLNRFAARVLQIVSGTCGRECDVNVAYIRR